MCVSPPDIYIYISVCVCMNVYVCVCVSVCVSTRSRNPFRLTLPVTTGSSQSTGASALPRMEPEIRTLKPETRKGHAAFPQTPVFILAMTAACSMALTE